MGLCPNARNPFHNCTEYCRERWGSLLVETPSESEGEREKEKEKNAGETLQARRERASSKLLREGEEWGESKEEEVEEEFIEPVKQKLNLQSGGCFFQF